MGLGLDLGKIKSFGYSKEYGSCSMICKFRAMCLSQHCLSSLFNACVNWSSLLNLSVPLLFHLRIGDHFIANFKALLCRLSELICIKHWEHRGYIVLVNKIVFHGRKQAQNLTALSIQTLEKL